MEEISILQRCYDPFVFMVPPFVEASSTASTSSSSRLCEVQQMADLVWKQEFL
jgi:hypothetical protein